MPMAFRTQIGERCDSIGRNAGSTEAVENVFGWAIITGFAIDEERAGRDRVGPRDETLRLGWNVTRPRGGQVREFVGAGKEFGMSGEE